MAPSPLQQRRTHNTLLFQKLLNLRDSASPFTLILDTLEQSGGPAVREFARRAKISKNQIIFISFSTLRKKVPFEVSSFITARGKSLGSLRNEILSHLPAPPTAAPNTSSSLSKYLLIIDTLNPLSSSHPQHLSNFLSSLLLSPQISLIATYHTDVPLTNSPSSSSYAPSPLTTLIYLATAILTVSSLSQTLARKRARDKSHQEPSFGIQEGREGVIIGMKRRAKDEQGSVINMEIRRRSGRGVTENFVLLPPVLPSTNLQIAKPGKLSSLSEFILLDDHPLYSSPSTGGGDSAAAGKEEEMNTTFNLGLTEKQKRDRENVVLPYFDAQRDGGAAGPGDGGRILYDMGAEDREDFDDEEDEI
ncbi:related to protein conferring sensitivity to killer toxin [Rhynchosporium graminicola]|uniref:Elongator complex protein 5 n=1 Tax=Rhynchosporium graminicola TaxID=2792576 RepID=A0A1E1KI38_9HELO|nr:related to protein conferring sensitivity to killer toxin [Rhynchosporium commune]